MNTLAHSRRLQGNPSEKATPVPGAVQTDLTRMIVHDLKGPLASVMANLDLLLEHGLSSTGRELAETALSGCHDLYRMIQNLLEIGKLEAGMLELNLSIIQLEPLLASIIKKLAPLAERKSIRMKMDCNCRVESFAADAPLLERILFNLVMNAVTFTPTAGEIRLITREGREGETVLIGVADNGPGVPLACQKLIFDLYRQTLPPVSDIHGDRKQEYPVVEDSPSFQRRNYSGHVGMGLTFCKLAAEGHGGRIWVESSEGRGSTFFVELPITLIPEGAGLLD